MHNAVDTIRKATIPDVTHVHRLVNVLADNGDMLPRALSDIYECLRDYYVVEREGRIVACCALHVCWEDLAEIRSLAVEDDWRGHGIGRALVNRCLDESRELGLATVFALTLRPEFFERCGFQREDMAALPRKVWGECFHCPKFPNCDEVALVYRLPIADSIRVEQQASRVE